MEYEKKKDALFLKQTMEVSHLLEGLEDLAPKVMYKIFKTKMAQA